MIVLRLPRSIGRRKGNAMQAQQIMMWPVLQSDKPAPRKGNGRFASGFVVHEDLFALQAPEAVPVGAECEERKAARLREIEARKAVKV